MKIVIAPDSFKGSCSAINVANQIEKGIKKVHPHCNVVKIPIADGGEGTVEALILGAGGEVRKKEVVGPLGQKVKAAYGILKNGIGVIELAAASGLTLVPENRRNPLYTTSYGTGQLILSAISDGCKKIVVGLGGSATNDGGLGIAQAFGVSFRDDSGRELGYGGGELKHLAVINTSGMDKRLLEAEIIVACDVSNPLCGHEGASHVYGPQKGATPLLVQELDKNLSHYAQVIKEQLHTDIAGRQGAGAAGGASVALMVFAGAKMEPGIQVVLDITGFDRHLQDADLVITGEGRIDGQSIYGKVPVGVALRAKKYHLPVLAIVGGVGSGAEACYGYGVDGIMSIVNGGMSLEKAMAEVDGLLVDAAERAMRIVGIGGIMEKRIRRMQCQS